MPLVHRRHNNSNNKNNNKSIDEEEVSTTTTTTTTTTQLPTSSKIRYYFSKTASSTSTSRNNNNDNTTTKKKRLRLIIQLVLVVVQVLIIGIALFRTKPKIQSLIQFVSIIVATFFVSFPILLTVASGLGIDNIVNNSNVDSNSNSNVDSNSSDSIGSKLLHTTLSLSSHEQYIPLSIVVTIVGNQLPSYLTSGCVAIALTIFGLISRPTTTTTTSTTTTKMTTTTTKQVHKTTSSTSPTTKKKHFNSKNTTTTTSTTTTKKLHHTIGPMHAVIATFCMTFVMLLENFLVWVVSATYKDSQQVSSLPKPLQDNGKIILRYFILQILNYQHVVKLRNMINVQWLLVTGLGLSLGTVVLYGTGNNKNNNKNKNINNNSKSESSKIKIQRSLWSLAVRGLLTMSIARLIRTISFSITVLPSQNRNCYFHRFPYPPPKLWKDWLVVGFIPQINGGCNDLIISGHATVTSTMACIITSIVNKHSTFTVALWMLVIFDYMIEVYEGFHYSVDMFLGGVIVNFIWNTLAFIEMNDSTNHQNDSFFDTTIHDEDEDEVEHDDDDRFNQGMDTSSGGENVIESGGCDDISNNDNGQAQQQQQQQQQQFYSINQVTKMELLRYAIPPIGAYLQVTNIIPSGVGNYTIVAYILYAMIRVYKIGFDQYSQHVLFCLLYMALGVYL